MSSLINSVSRLVGLGIGDLLAIAEKAPWTYRKYNIPKKRGGLRRIHHPSKETKLLQYATIDLLISKMQVHRAAVGFIPGLQSPLRVNALMHAKNEYLARVDFKDFFPSLRPTDFLTSLEKSKIPEGIEIDAEDKKFLRNILFVKQVDGLGLPIGAPSSPMVSNVIMLELDQKIQSLADSYDAVYTRYADDLIFSTSSKNVSLEIINGLKQLLADSVVPNLSINKSKTCFMSRNCRRAVTGLIITTQGDVSVGRSNKRRLRALLCQSIYGKISDRDSGYLQGYLAFLLDVEPGYFNSLVLKYGSAVVERAMKARNDA